MLVLAGLGCCFSRVRIISIICSSIRGARTNSLRRPKVTNRGYCVVRLAGSRVGGIVCTLFWGVVVLV